MAPKRRFYFLWNWTLGSVLVSLDIPREAPLGLGFRGLSSPPFPRLLPLSPQTIKAGVQRVRGWSRRSRSPQCAQTLSTAGGLRAQGRNSLDKICYRFCGVLKKTKLGSASSSASSFDLPQGGEGLQGGHHHRTVPETPMSPGSMRVPPALRAAWAPPALQGDSNSPRDSPAPETRGQELGSTGSSGTHRGR